MSEIDMGVTVDDTLNTVCESNEEGFRRILKLYARTGQVIVDPTHGHGRFWKLIDRTQYDARCTDLADGIDMRALPYASETVDLEVIDPPYRYTPARNVKQDDAPGHGVVDGLYNLQAAKLANTAAVVELYVAGFVETRRVLRHGGFLVVKCQDTVQDGKNLWVHDVLRERAEVLGFAMRDMLIVNPRSVLATRWERQRHLRKAHSYFLIFRKGGLFPFGIPAMERR
jgi:DNA modification methylase